MQQDCLCICNLPLVALVTSTQLFYNSFHQHMFTEGLLCATHYECAEKLTKTKNILATVQKDEFCTC